MKINKKAAFIICILVVVTAVFCYTLIQTNRLCVDENPKISLEQGKDKIIPTETSPVMPQEEVFQKETTTKSSDENAETVSSEEIPEAVSENDLTDSVPVCTLSVQCSQVLENMDKLKENKKSIIPENGMIFAEQTIEFSEGESVFDVLYRVMRDNGIYIEFVKTPMYNTVYIEGIANLYEFDCGTYSGWMYSVNGITPRVGSSQYQVANGDKIEFFYCCSLEW